MKNWMIPTALIGTLAVLTACATDPQTEDAGILSHLSEGEPIANQNNGAPPQNRPVGGLPGLMHEETGSAQPGPAPTAQPQEEPAWQSLPSGLQYQVFQPGTGATAGSGDTVAVHYVGVLEDGTPFDSSIERNEPFTFTLGAGRVIQGWEQGVLGMKVGEVRRLAIPPALGYGQQGSPPTIPPNAILVFTIQLLGIQE